MEQADIIFIDGKVAATVKKEKPDHEFQLFSREDCYMAPMYGYREPQSIDHRFLSIKQVRSTETLRQILLEQDSKHRILTLSNWLTFGMVETDTFEDPEITTILPFCSDDDWNNVSTLVRLFLLHHGFVAFQQNVTLEWKEDDHYYKDMTIPFYLKCNGHRYAIYAIDRDFGYHVPEHLGIETIYIDWTYRSYADELLEKLVELGVPQVAEPISKEVYDAIDFSNIDRLIW
jgi:hypothetical protein